MQSMYFDTTTANAATGTILSNYFFATTHGMASSIDSLIKLIIWTLSCVGWMLTLTSWDGFNWFFVIWVEILQKTQMILLVIMTAWKIVAMFTDTKNDYAVGDGTSASN